MTQPLILVDASSYFFRAFHALPPLTNSKGQPTGAVYGVANMVKRLLKDYPSNPMALVFDAKGKTFRDDWYSEYKAHRPPMPDDLRSQFQPLIQLLDAMGLPILIIEGVEADDVIGTLTQKATAQGQSVIISTGDKDMTQLINEQVTLINTMTNQTLTLNTVKEKFGVNVEQFIDYLTLMGDKADNIPGVTKCGPKTAVKWLDEYGSLDNLVLHAKDIPGKIGEHLRASLAELPLSKRLITIKTDVDLPVSLSDLTVKKPNRERLIDLTRELEFKGWLKDLLTEDKGSLQAEDDPPRSEQQPTLLTINTESELLACMDDLSHASLLSLHTETNPPGTIDALIVGIGLAMGEDRAFYIPISHQEGNVQCPKAQVFQALKGLLENPAIKKIGHNLKHDYNALRQEGIVLQGLAFDTMLESYVLNSSSNQHDSASLALKYLGVNSIRYEDVVGKGAKRHSFDTISVAEAATYVASAARINFCLHHKLYPMLTDSLKSVLTTIEMPLLTVLADMEFEGVLIDETILAEQGERLKHRMVTLEQEAMALAGEPFNLNSPKQLQDILFNKLNLPILEKTPTGQASTAESVLQALASDFRLPAVILDYRTLSKLVSTYIDALPQCINPATHRVHTSYNQAVTATGRLSSSDPNLQNIPIRREEGRLIRKAFIASPHHVLVALDYSQIELRIMAHLSHDENLIKAFNTGSDIHAATASEIFQVPLDAVTAEQRRRSKAINFGLIYGMSAFGLSRQLNISRHDAEHYIDMYFQRYPGVLRYMNTTRQLAHEQGYVETLFGRRLYLPEINTQNMMRRKAAERMAINAPMQGTAADIIKKAMIAIANWKKEQGLSFFNLIMQVHDELVFEVHQDHVDSTIERVQTLMEHTVELSVPIRVSVGVGSNWDEAH